MKLSNLVLAAAVLALSGCTESGPPALKVDKSVYVDAPFDRVWSELSPFCAISDWHPAVTGCEERDENGSSFRILTLGDGAQIKEKHLKDLDNGYAYSIIEGPLPVKNYNASFEIDKQGEGARITWKTSFHAAEGAGDSEATDVISGVFDAGLAEIKKRFM